MAKVEILDMITYRETTDDGDYMDVIIDPMPPPLSELQEDHPGMSWHPILERWVPDADINKRMIVDESEIFPSDTGEDEVEDDDECDEN